MKTSLIVISLSPLCLLSLIMNFHFTCQGGQSIASTGFLSDNFITIIVLLICFLWLITSVAMYIYFKFLVSFDRRGGWTIRNVQEEKEADLNFFLTIIMPLLLGELENLQNAIAFFIIFIIIFMLLSKTNLFYTNPVLTVLGYHVYTFEFECNEMYREPCLGISSEKIPDKIENISIEYKSISENVLYIKFRRKTDVN
jgi:hypothetical protein